MADRELLAVPAGDVEAALGGYAALGGIDEVAVLSTRYRIEIYASTRCPTAALLALSQALTARAGRPLPLVELHGEEAFRHLVRVAASLESAFLGEPEIAVQVKEALRRAVDAGVAGRELTGVLNRALDVADRVRSESAIGGGSSWGPAVAALAEKVLGSLSGRRVAVIGAGNAARASASHLESCGAVVVVLDREIPHGLSLQSDVGAQPRPVQALEDELLRADVVVSAAPASLTAFRPDAMVRAARVRRRPLVLVDLSVPRTIPAETGAVPDVYLCDVDDLHRVMRAATADRAAAVAHAEEIIGEEIARWGRGEAELRTVPIIEEMQTRAAAIARSEVERTLRRLAVDAEIEKRLDAMAESIVSRLLNQPSARLRRAASEGGQGEALLAAAKEIFQLGSESPTRRTNFA